MRRPVAARAQQRIELNKVTFEVSRDAEGIVQIRLDYTIRTTNTRTNFVYPFYLDEASRP